MTTVRILEVAVQVTLIVDDGQFPQRRVEKPVLITAREWPDIVAGVETARAKLEEQMNATIPPAP